ncbi:MAG: ABC transporter permease [Lachnospiraceae bacterium]|nr:ABC transporter permease [Lachnospiraceae bacterium]
MRNVILFIKNGHRQNRIIILIALLAAFLLANIYTMMSGLYEEGEVDPVYVAVINKDPSVMSEAFLNYMREDLGMQVLTDGDYDFFVNKLIDRDISAIIEIKENSLKNFLEAGRAGEYELTTLDDYENAAFIKVYLESFLGSMDLLIQSADHDEVIFTQMLTAFEKENKTVQSENAKAVDHERLKAVQGMNMAEGFYCMFIMFSSLAMAYSIMEDKERGLYDRIKAAPVSPIQYLLGSITFTFLSGIGTIVLFELYIRIKGDEVIIPFGKMTILMSLFLLMGIAFCLMASLLCRTKMLMMFLIIGFLSIGPILGGSYFPVDRVPQAVANISRIMPHYWFMNAIRGLCENASMKIGPNILVLVLFTVLFFLIAGCQFVKRERKC